MIYVIPGANVEWLDLWCGAPRVHRYGGPGLRGSGAALEGYIQCFYHYMGALGPLVVVILIVTAIANIFFNAFVLQYGQQTCMCIIFSFFNTELTHFFSHEGLSGEWRNRQVN